MKIGRFFPCRFEAKFFVNFFEINPSFFLLIKQKELQLSFAAFTFEL